MGAGTEECGEKLTARVGPFVKKPLKAIFTDTSIEFCSYPFRTASVFKKPIVYWDLIKDIDVSKPTLEVRLITGEILFVSLAQEEELKNFAARLELPQVEREDIWSDLVEPFLDTEFSFTHRKQTLLRLSTCGMSAPEIRQIRKRIAFAMYFYQGFIGEWQYMGLLDALIAVRQVSSPWTFRVFYRYAMEIANRAPLRAYIDSESSLNGKP